MKKKGIILLTLLAALLLGGCTKRPTKKMNIQYIMSIQKELV